jgi:hypothetical protein
MSYAMVTDRRQGDCGIGCCASVKVFTAGEEPHDADNTLGGTHGRQGKLTLLLL